MENMTQTEQLLLTIQSKILSEIHNRKTIYIRLGSKSVAHIPVDNIEMSIRKIIMEEYEKYIAIEDK